MLFLGHHPPYLWGRSATDLKLESRPCSLTIRAPEIHLFPPPQPWGYKHEPPCLAFGKGWFWELNSGDYASKVSTLPPAELPPYPVRNWKQSPLCQTSKVFSEFCHSAWFVSGGFSREAHAVAAPQRPGSQLAHSPLWLTGIFPNYLSGWWERRRVSLTMMVVLILQQSKQEPLPSDSGVYGQPSSNRTLPVEIWSCLWSGTRVGPQGPHSPSPPSSLHCEFSYNNKSEQQKACKRLKGEHPRKKKPGSLNKHSYYLFT